MKKEKIILVLNGILPKKNHLIDFLKNYDTIICVDGAANKVVNANLKPDYILGDLDSVKKTNRLVCVEESWSYASVGSEIVSIVQKEAFDYLDSPILKVNSADVPMPYSSVLEKMYLPQVEDIILAIEKVCYI